MADHFIETPEYEQSKYLGLAHVKVAESVKKRLQNISFAGWLVKALPSHFRTPRNQNSCIRPCLLNCFVDKIKLQQV